MGEKIIKQLNTLQVGDMCAALKDAFIENINVFGNKSITLYCVVEDNMTHNEEKIKIIIRGEREFVFENVSEEEWNEHSVGNKL